MTSVRISPDAKSVVTGSSDRSIKIWNIARNTYRQLFTLRHTSPVYSIDLSTDSFTAVSGHLDGGLRFVDTRSGERTLEVPSIHTDCITSVQFDPTNSTQLLTCSRDSTLKLIDVRKSDVIKTFNHQDLGIISFSSMASFSPDGKCIIMQSAFDYPLFRSSAIIVNIAVQHLFYLNAGIYVAVGSGTTGKVFIWCINGDQPEKQLSFHTSGVEGIAWGRGGRSGQQVATVDKEGDLILWV